MPATDFTNINFAPHSYLSTLCLRGSENGCCEGYFNSFDGLQFKNPLLASYDCFNSLFLLLSEDSMMRWIRSWPLELKAGPAIDLLWGSGQSSVFSSTEIGYNNNTHVRT